MDELDPECQWEVFGSSVRGAAHVRAGLPNQDAIGWQVGHTDTGSYRLLAVSDGHGSAKSFRSERGAQFAVMVAIELLYELQLQTRGLKSLSAVQSAVEIDLPKRIVQNWREAVEAQLRDQPLCEAELAKLSPTEQAIVKADPFIAYGATLLAALLTDRFGLYLQLGDGDVLLVGHDRTVSRPLPADERNFANETLSLCSQGANGGRFPGAGSGAWTEFRHRLQPLEQPPALVLLSTDGYANSFRTDGDFLKVGSDLLEALRTDGVDSLKMHLPEWLAEASQAGSGDDVTLGVMFRRCGTSKALAPKTPTTNQTAQAPGAPAQALEPELGAHASPAPQSRWSLTRLFGWRRNPGSP